jgi:general secretion pathway protein A
MELATIPGVQREPFIAAEPAPAAYFSASLEAAAAVVSHAAGGPSRVAVVLGASGIGKTTLLRRLARDLRPTWAPVLLTAPAASSADEFLEELRTKLGLVGAGTGRRAVERALSELEARNPGTPALLIDDAERLGDAALAGLVRFLECGPGHRAPFIVLAGRPELRERLAHARLRRLRGHIARTCWLAPLSAAEVAAFVRLEQLANGPEPGCRFSAGAVSRIAAQSHGVPASIRQLCREGVALARADDRSEVVEADLERLALRSWLDKAPRSDAAVALPARAMARSGWFPQAATVPAAVAIAAAILALPLESGHRNAPDLAILPAAALAAPAGTYTAPTPPYPAAPVRTDMQAHRVKAAQLPNRTAAAVSEGTQSRPIDFGDREIDQAQ